MKIFLNDIAGASYTFNKTAKTVTLTGLTTLTIDKVLAIVNTTRGVTIFNPTSASTTGTISGNVITLAYDTTSQDNADNLMIVLDYSPGQTTMAKSSPVAIASDQLNTYTARSTVHNSYNQALSLNLINPSGIVAGLVTTSSAHNLRVNDLFYFSSLTGASGGVATRSNEGGSYQSGPLYIVSTVPTSTTFTYTVAVTGGSTSGHSATTGTIVLGQGQLIDMRGYTSTILFIPMTQLSWNATISLEASVDGQLWSPTSGMMESFFTGGYSKSTIFSMSNMYLFSPCSIKINATPMYLRVRIVAFTTGPITCYVTQQTASVPETWGTVINSGGIAYNGLIQGGIYPGNGDGSSGRPWSGYSFTDGQYAPMNVAALQRRSASSAGGSGSWAVYPKNSDIFKSVQVSANGNTTVWTPTSGWKYNLLAFKIIVPQNCTTAAGGVVTFDLQDNGTTIGLAHDIYVPAVAGNLLGGYDSGWIILGGYGKIGSGANVVLTMNLSQAITAGVARIILAGVEV